MSEFKHLMNNWKVRSIEALPNNRGVAVEFGIEGRPSIRFKTRQFAVGKRSRKTAALARFASKAGYGELEHVFHYLSALPSNQVGDLFPVGPIGLDPHGHGEPALSCAWPD